eukprot:TRINITY_DN12643_c0_g1_i2.p4 TRINITY_DN12643_c0_g1~~TRINITY_DN12643_c0_g1_i2.p4  ORF type:complete len:105 (+),score=14.15 TRINITY_DN12643_c0_g1_i2:102-416(+)
MSQLVEVLGQRVVSAFAGPIHWPRVVGYTCACLAGIGATALPIGLISGYLKFKPITQPTIIIKVASVALILPGLVVVRLMECLDHIRFGIVYMHAPVESSQGAA